MYIYNSSKVTLYIYILKNKIGRGPLARVAKAYMQTSTSRIKKKKEALEGLAAVVNRVTCSVPVSGSTLYVHVCHPRGALPAPGLAGCPVSRGE